MNSYFSLFRNYANFKGYMKRRAYWTALFFHGLILLIPLYPAVRRFVDPAYTLPSFYIPWVLPIWCFYNVLMIIPLWSAAVRRFHTLPRSGWWLLVGIIPLAGWYLVLSWLFQKGYYEEYMWRLKKAGPATFEEKRKEMERPRGGVWFFVVLAVLSASGWFLNRQIRQTGSVEAALVQLLDKSRTLLPFSDPGEGSGGSPEENGSGKAPQSVTVYRRDPSFDPTFTPTPTPEPTPTPVPTSTIPANVEIN